MAQVTFTAVANFENPEAINLNPVYVIPVSIKEFGFEVKATFTSETEAVVTHIGDSPLTAAIHLTGTAEGVSNLTGKTFKVKDVDMEWLAKEAAYTLES